MVTHAMVIEVLFIICIPISLDIDECFVNADVCDHVCTNTIGSYTCSCNDGYALDDDGHTCNGNWMFYSIEIYNPFSSFLLDINECDSANGGCAQICINLLGTKNNCSCEIGYNVADDMINCEGK